MTATALGEAGSGASKARQGPAAPRARTDERELEVVSRGHLGRGEATRAAAAEAGDATSVRQARTGEATG
jgi:hypothetical protein